MTRTRLAWIVVLLMLLVSIAGCGEATRPTTTTGTTVTVVRQTPDAVREQMGFNECVGGNTGNTEAEITAYNACASQFGKVLKLKPIR